MLAKEVATKAIKMSVRTIRVGCTDILDRCALVLWNSLGRLGDSPFGRAMVFLLIHLVIAIVVETMVRRNRRKLSTRFADYPRKNEIWFEKDDKD